MFRYRVHLEDGSDAGEATYAQMIFVGDEIHLGAGQRESPFVGMLKVEVA